MTWNASAVASYRRANYKNAKVRLCYMLSMLATSKIDLPVFYSASRVSFDLPI